jgi:hypothetical protein
MESADPARPFPKVERVIYRHFMTGKTVERKSVREARLIFALEAARRGIEAGIVIPQFLSGDLSRCRQCPAQEVCIPGSGDIEEWFLPTEAERAKRVASAMARVGRIDGKATKSILAILKEERVLPSDFLNAISGNDME